jgi:hypothetical protein
MFYENVLMRVENGTDRAEVTTMDRVYRVNFFKDNRFTHGVSVFTLEEAQFIAENTIGKSNPTLLNG